MTLLEHQRVISSLKATLSRTKQQMTQEANKHRLFKEFNVGEWVYLRLQVYRQSTVTRRTHQKLSRRYFGPFQIIGRVGKVAYRLQLPEGSRIHNVFHISLLKPCFGRQDQHVVPIPDKFLGDTPVEAPEEILDTRTVINGGKSQQQHLIKWKGRDITEATWEDTAETGTGNTGLEDKVDVERGATDTGLNIPTQTRPARLIRKPTRYLD